MKYVIDSTVPYTGSVLTVINEDGTIGYSNCTDFESYKIEEQNPNLVALTWEELEPLVAKHRESLIEPFTETTEDRYYDALGCVPPKRYETAGSYTFFFVGECYTQDLYMLYVSDGLSDKYYKALKPISANYDEMIKELYQTIQENGKSENA